MAATIVNGQDCKGTTVCVTGAAGFVASWLVKLLVDKGYTVHATVRDPDNEAKVRHLLDIPGATERLKLFRAELSEDGSFDAAVAGCQGVFHLATPIDFAPKDPENDVIKPAINGTLNVLKSCTKATTVKRVVVTSSAATVSVNLRLRRISTSTNPAGLTWISSRLRSPLLGQLSSVPYFISF